MSYPVGLVGDMQGEGEEPCKFLVYEFKDWVLCKVDISYPWRALGYFPLTSYYTFVHLYLTYCNHIWGNIYQSNLKRLCVLQNKIVRIIAGVKPRESAGPLYDSLGIMKLTDLNKYLIARFMFTYCINMVPKLFSSYFLRNYNVSSYDLRSTNCFHLPLVATDFGKNGIRYRGPFVFNKLLIDGIDCTVSEAVFMNQLKRSVKTGKL